MCNSSYPKMKPEVILGTKVVMGFACTVSIAAACWVITTYILFKDLRTTARQLLVNLSIADILVASSHFLGAMVNYDRFLPSQNNGTLMSDASVHDPLCVSQAVVTMFGSIALFLWTMCVAVYILALSILTKKNILKKVVVLMYIVCWGVPIPFVIMAAATKSLGFQFTGSTTGL